MKYVLYAKFFFLMMEKLMHSKDKELVDGHRVALELDSRPKLFQRQKNV